MATSLDHDLKAIDTGIDSAAQAIGQRTLITCFFAVVPTRPPGKELPGPRARV
jgi:hypothetical protein